MKKIYESFYEIAEDFVDGEHWPHSISNHTEDECLAWQHGVYEFAKWLDAYGLKIAANPEIYEKLWKEWRSHKPEGLKVLKHIS